MSRWNVNTIAEFNASEGASSLRYKRNEFKSAVRLSNDEEVMKKIRKPSLVSENNKEVTKNHKVSQIVAATILLYFRRICWIRKCRVVSEKNKEVKKTRCDPCFSQFLHSLLSA